MWLVRRRMAARMPPAAPPPPERTATSAEARASRTGALKPPGSCTKSVVTAAAPSPVGSTATGRTDPQGIGTAFGESLRARRGGFLRSGDRKVSPPSSSSKMDRHTLAKGRRAMCSICAACKRRARRMSKARFTFHTTTHAARNKKKQEKKTEKKTKRSMRVWSWRKKKAPTCGLLTSA